MLAITMLVIGFATGVAATHAVRDVKRWLRRKLNRMLRTR